MNLSPTLPQFHVQFGLTPLVKVNRFMDYDVLGQEYYSLKLNHCSCSDLSCRCVVVSASVDESIISYPGPCRQNVDQHGVIKVMDANISVSDYVHVSVNDMKSILDKDLENFSFLIPNLQRLDLTYHDLSIDNLRGLRAIADNCHNLKGLNLRRTHVVSLNLMVFWEILSGMKLTHLLIAYCLITSADIYNQPEINNLYATLQAIEISSNMGCKACKSSFSEGLLCLSHFSSLQYCRLSYHSSVVQDIATSC